MKPHLLLCSLSIACLGASPGVTWAAPNEVPQRELPADTSAQNFEIFTYQGRLVRDAIALHLEEIKPDESWVVARIKPDAKSPVAELVGSYWDSRTQQMVQNGERVYTRVTEWGVLEPIEVVSGTTPVSPTYNVQSELNPRLYQFTERYGLFSGNSPRTAIFRIAKNADDETTFEPAFLLADEWIPFVQPALKTVQEDKTVFDATTVADHIAQLQQFLENPNPLVAITAARLLSNQHQLKAAFVSGPMSRVKGLELSVFTFLYLKQPQLLPTGPGNNNVNGNASFLGPPADEGWPVENLQKFIDSSTDIAVLKSMMEGLTALRTAPRRGGLVIEPRSKGLIDRASARQQELSKGIKPVAHQLP